VARKESGIASSRSKPTQTKAAKQKSAGAKPATGGAAPADSLRPCVVTPPPAPPKQAPPAKPKRRVLLVDDHPMVRERLAELINQEADLEVCGEAEDVVGAMEAVEQFTPDVAVVDITLKDSYGIELIKNFKAHYPKLPALVLSMHDEALYAERALHAGARGYMTKQEATRKVIGALRQVLAGQIYLSERMAASILQKVAGSPATAMGGSPVESLTDRELEVFQLLGQGSTVRELAKTLHVSVKTVEAHREHIKKKMNLKSSAELLRYAIDYTLQEGRGERGGAKAGVRSDEAEAGE
jgi:DNA-binding NarL/FixJ family response regulator